MHHNWLINTAYSLYRYHILHHITIDKGMSGNFKEAADFAAKLVKESAWSPAIYTWMQAVALVSFLKLQIIFCSLVCLDCIE